MSFKHKDIIYINFVFTDSFLLLELLNPPWLFNLSIGRMWWISIARICKYHTHNHTLAHSVVGWRVGAWQIRTACLGVALHLSQGCSSGGDDKWGKQIVKFKLKGEDFFIRRISQLSSFWFSGLERTLKIISGFSF